MYADRIEKNRIDAFKHFVEVIKKQNPDKVIIEGDIFSYSTKRGLKKTYKAWRSLEECMANTNDRIERVNGFVFTEILEEACTNG